MRMSRRRNGIRRSRSYEHELRAGYWIGSPRAAFDRVENLLRLLDALRRAAELQHVPCMHGLSRRAAGPEQARRGVRDPPRPRDALRDRALQPLRAQKLFLPRPSEGLSDQPVRAAALRA